MAAYYNEIEPFAAQWLRNLIAAGHIAPGDVDERSIVDVSPDDLKPYTQCHFFAGIGVWSHALRLAGWPDDRPVWTGSCPCQPFSVAGSGRGTADERHLWPELYRLIRARRPSVVFGEQVASKAGLQWLDTVYADLDSSGYAVAAADLCAASVGAPHIRSRLYWVSANSYRQSEPTVPRGSGAERSGSASHSWAVDAVDFDFGSRVGIKRLPRFSQGWMVDGFAGRLGRLRAYGNAIVPQVAQAFIEAYLET